MSAVNDAALTGISFEARHMKDYLVCFKKVECRVEIGVKVGGLPREVLRGPQGDMSRPL